MEVVESLEHITYGYYVRANNNSDSAKLNQIIDHHERIRMYRSKVEFGSGDKLYMQFTVIPEHNDDDHSGYLPDLNYIDQEICVALALAGYKRA